MTVLPTELRVPRRSLVDQSCDAIISLIEQRSLRAGDELPQAAELEQLLGVSRTVVREAVSHLMARGVLARDRRRYVIAEPGAQQVAEVLRFRLAQAHLEIAHLVELREAIEVQAAALAAQRRTDADVAAIDATVEAMAGSSQHDFTTHDLAFHHAIAEASGNPALPIVLEALGDLLEDHMRANLTYAVASGETMTSVVERHRTIAGLIAKGDTKHARERMQHEMDAARRAAHL